MTTPRTTRSREPVGREIERITAQHLAGQLAAAADEGIISEETAGALLAFALRVNRTATVLPDRLVPEAMRTLDALNDAQDAVDAKTNGGW